MPYPLLTRRQTLRSVAQVATASALIGSSVTAVFGKIVYATPNASSEAVNPFKVASSQQDKDDLRRRLKSTRFPEKETAAGWTQGVPVGSAVDLITYWGDGYDMDRLERRLNAYPQFLTSIDGLDIHFIHVKSKHPNALPIVLTHGWPGSVVEFLDVIDKLSNPTAHGGTEEDAFHVVIPSQPGFGRSGKPTETGWNVDKTAAAWAVLMDRIGYDRWVAQGGDWGSGVTHALGRARPPGLVAAHVNWPFVFPDAWPTNPDPEEKSAMEAALRFLSEQSGYYKEQATKPQTIGYALADTPSGQAMWIYEKFRAWTQNQGNPEDVLSQDEMLHNISLYWFTNSAASSAQIYFENSTHTYNGGHIDLPMAATVFPAEIYKAPRKWAEAMWPKLFYWNEVDRGGHFAAFEQPTLFANEMRNAFRTIRN